MPDDGVARFREFSNFFLFTIKMEVKVGGGPGLEILRKRKTRRNDWDFRRKGRTEWRRYK